MALKFDPETLENWVDFFDDNIGWIHVHLEDTKLLNKINLKFFEKKKKKKNGFHFCP